MTFETKYLERIRALLSKAEGTDNEHEASAFLAKAHELMIRHSLDEARVRADGRAQQRVPVTRQVVITPRSVGFQARADLFFAVAASLDLRSWWRPHLGRLTVAGFAEDVEQAEALYTSLLLQLEHATQTAMRSGKRPVVWDERAWAYRPLNGRTYRVSFMTGYVQRVADRLARIARDTHATVTADVAGSALALRDKKAHVDEWVDTNFTLGKPRARSDTHIDSDAYAAGATAGASAALGSRAVGAARPALAGGGDAA